MTIDRITAISAVRLKVPADIDKPDGQMRLDGMMAAATKRFGNQIPLLDPIQDMEVRFNNKVDENSRFFWKF